ncbi:MAG: putative lipopolysaccharide heptosyltransferase III [Deltaproteobacteria bacterium]|nr:putative lipopolysaccharide heptosyltransferase III [Deltaproteobacteria bacterium]
MAGSLLGEKISSLLVFKQRNIGDVLLSTPAIHALRSAWPQARIAVAVNSGTEAMIEGNPDIDRVIVFDRSARDAGGTGRWREEGRFLGEIRSWRPDLAVQLTEGDRGAILALLSGARFRVGVVPGRRGLWGKEKLFTHLSPRPSLYRHAVLRDLDVVGAAGIPPADPGLRFSFTEPDRSRVAALLAGAGIPAGAPYAVLQPGSRWKFKCWTDEGNAGLIAHLSLRRLHPVVTSGPDPEELAQVERIRERCTVPFPSLAGRLTFKELGALIASARLYVGVDSAPMHLAAAVGTPVIALFGPTGAFNWAPWEGIDWGYTESSPRGTRSAGRHLVLQKEWGCVPCGKDGCGGTKRSRCMEEITIGEVTEAVDRALSRSLGA